MTEEEQAALIGKHFGSVGRDVCLCPGFMCDSGKNIHGGVPTRKLKDVENDILETNKEKNEDPDYSR